MKYFFYAAAVALLIRSIGEPLTAQTVTVCITAAATGKLWPYISRCLSGK